MEVKDLQHLVDQVHEAEALLLRKDEVEREIANLERQQAKMVSDLHTASVSLDDINAKVVQQSNFFEHEKRRLSLDLDQHRQAVEVAKKLATATTATAKAQTQEEHRRLMVSFDSERQVTEKDLLTLKAEHARYRDLVADLKARVHNLVRE